MIHVYNIWKDFKRVFGPIGYFILFCNVTYSVYQTAGQSIWVAALSLVIGILLFFATILTLDTIFWFLKYWYIIFNVSRTAKCSLNNARIACNEALLITMTAEQKK